MEELKVVSILKEQLDRYEREEEEVRDLIEKIKDTIIYQDIGDEARRHLREVLKALRNIFEDLYE